MRLVSYGDAGSERAGLLVGGLVHDIEAIDPKLNTTVRGLLAAGELERLSASAAGVLSGASQDGIRVGEVRMGPPVPDPTKVICLGLNYADHAREQQKAPPERPLLFAKAPSALCGANDPVVLPPQDECVDCEAELAVVIGKTIRNAGRDEAMEAVAGYMAFNDVSARTIQRGDRQWFRGKSFDTFGPCGPALVTRDEIPDPHSLAISSYINDRMLQESSTSELIFDIPHVISYVSQTMTLLPGDIISTGTPAGVGVFRDPQVFLKAGDTVTVKIENVGTLKNEVVSG